MAELTGSPIVDVRRITNQTKIVKYITKYIGKDPTKFEGTKRYWRSQDYLKPDDDETPRPIIPFFYWETLDRPWRECAAYFEKLPGTLTYHRSYATYQSPVPP